MDECDLEVSDFGADENIETLADEKFEKEEVPNAPFKTKQAVIEYFRNSIKMKHRTLQAIQRMHKFVKNVSQLHMWEKQMDKLGDKKNLSEI